MPAFHRVHGGRDLHLFAVDEDFAAVALVRAEEQPRGLGAPRAHETRKAENLAAPQHEGDVFYVVGAEVLCLQNDFAALGHVGLRLRVFIDHAADHHLDDLIHRGLAVSTVPTVWPSRMTVMRSDICLSSSIRWEM